MVKLMVVSTRTSETGLGRWWCPLTSETPGSYFEVRRPHHHVSHVLIVGFNVSHMEMIAVNLMKADVSYLVGEVVALINYGL